MIFPSCKVCFGRRGLKADKPSSVEVEVYFGGKRKWLSTGVAVFRNQWHPVRHVINHAQAPALNAQIDAAVRKVSDFILHCQLDGKEFSFSGLSEHLNRCMMDLSFFDFVRDRIAERCDIREVTRKSHRRLLSALKAVGAVIGRRITSHMGRHTFKELNLLLFTRWFTNTYRFDNLCG
jgi:hypothetical protein